MAARRTFELVTTLATLHCCCSSWIHGRTDVSTQIPSLVWIEDYAFGIDNIGNDVGQVAYDIRPSFGSATQGNNTDIFLVLYKEDTWQQAKLETCDCNCKWALAEQKEAISASEKMQTGTIGVRNSYVPSFMYITLLVCNATVHVDYDIHTTFVGTGHPELPYDVIGLYETYITCFAVFVVIAVLLVFQHMWIFHSHWTSTALPVKILALALLLWGAEVFFLMIHWIRYTIDGIGM
jgi:hypothetical protein